MTSENIGDLLIFTEKIPYVRFQIVWTVEMMQSVFTGHVQT